MAIDTQTVSELRAKTGAGVVDCKKALEECGGDIGKAAEHLRKKGIAKAGTRGERTTKEGMVHAYIHPNNMMGVLVEVQCETDFVARTDAFQQFVHDVAMQIAATNPLYLSPDAIPPEVVEKEKELAMAEFEGSSKPREVIEKIAEGKLAKFYSEVCLLNQAFIKDEDKTIEELLKEKIATTGENMRITRFVRFALSE
ncbi:MAG: translation elongation factor Ts [Patescibacteria group bacterium]|nr:translation elongation factor Ts [Patescibacteria group bacterium]